MIASTAKLDGKRGLLFLQGLVISLLAGLCPAVAVPIELNYQGHVAVDGRAYEGVGLFKFKLIDASNQTQWSNDGGALTGGEPSQAVSLQMRRGVYSVRLGDAGLANMVAIPLAIFTNDTLRVRVWFSDGTNGFQQLVPDGKVGTVAFAIRAESARTVEALPDGLIEQRHLSTGLIGQIGGNLVSSNNVWAGENRFEGRLIATNLQSIFAGQFSGDGGGLTNVAAGPVGPEGPVGPQGVKGDTGSTGSQGPLGPIGPIGPRGLTFRGAWSSSANYAANDAVSHLGSAWLAKRANTNVAPVEGADWTLLAQKGDIGPQGARGAEGAQGPTGPIGAQGPKGDNGPVGAIGATGATGPIGPQGEKGLMYRGGWNSGTSYVIDDLVYHNGSGWMALRPNLNVSPIEGADWSLLVLQGTQGLVGPKGDPGGGSGIGFRGNWSSAINYTTNESVVFLGSAWIARRNNQNVTPVEGLDWTVLAQKGDQGSQGLQGPQGLLGAVGPAGSKGDKGDAGVAGPAGADGPQGIQGPKGLTFKGAWGSAIGYVADDAVAHLGSAWLAKRSNQNVTPVEGADWTLLAQKGDAGLQGPQGDVGVQGATGSVGPQGPIGPQGVKGDTGSTGSQGPLGPIGPRGLTFRGAWSSSANYAANDAVSHLGSAWLAKRANTNVAPVEGADWTLLAQKGDTGPQGSQGAEGAQGPTGSTGPQGPKGDTGSIGAVGATGAAGPFGPQGARGLTYRGAWNSGTSYVIDDLVYHNGSGWMALRANQNVTPAEGADWSLLVLQGVQGLIGPKGDPGGGSGIGFRGNWSSLINYTTNESVVFLGSAWIARRNNQNVTPVEGLDWTVLAQKGDQGAQGPQGPQGLQGNVGPQGSKGIVFKGSWSSSANYIADDAVINSGSAWLAIRANQNVTPVEGADWTLLVQKGDPGPQGSQGVTGAQGAVGPAGSKGDKGDAGVAGPAGADGPQGIQGPKGLTFKGAWGSAIGYVADDAVAHLGSAWLAKRSNQNVTPVEGADWTLLAQKGDAGLQGPSGPQGPQGNVGSQGSKGDKGDKGDTGATGPAGTTTAGGLVSGTLADARLSANVGLLNRHQRYTGSNTYSGVFKATNSANLFNGTFVGSGAGLISLPAASISGVIPTANIPGLDATKLSSGTLTVGRIPDLDAAKITAGTIADARIGAGIARAANVTADLVGASNALSGRLVATNNALSVSYNSTVNSASNVLSGRLIATNTALSTLIDSLDTRITSTTNGLGGRLLATNSILLASINNEVSARAAAVTATTNGLNARLIATNAALSAEISDLTAKLSTLSNSFHSVSNQVEATVTAALTTVSTDPNDSALTAKGYFNFMKIAAPSWVNGSVNGSPSGVSGHSGVWTGNDFVAWGGNLGSGQLTRAGGIYDPNADSWIALSTVDAPEARISHSAVWTGSQMLVWGGFGTISYLKSGGRYTRATQFWAAMTTTGAPDGRTDHAAIWTGSKMIIWGGRNGSGFLNDGAIYDPAADTWTAISVAGPPAARHSMSAVWAGDRMIIWGGTGVSGELNTGSQLIFSGGNPTSWTATSTTSGPSTRTDHTAVWTGSRMIVWGGKQGGGFLANGGVFDPTGNSWAPLSNTGAPAARSAHHSFWTGQEMLIWGGTTGAGTIANGGAYSLGGDSWRSLSTAGSPLLRSATAAVWTGSDLLVFGGLNASSQPQASLQKLLPQPDFYFYRKP